MGISVIISALIKNAKWVLLIAVLMGFFLGINAYVGHKVEKAIVAERESVAAMVEKAKREAALVEEKLRKVEEAANEQNRLDEEALKEWRDLSDSVIERSTDIGSDELVAPVIREAFEAIRRNQ